MFKRFSLYCRLSGKFAKSKVVLNLTLRDSATGILLVSVTPPVRASGLDTLTRFAAPVRFAPVSGGAADELRLGEP
jgi:hypothetical protein